MQRHRVFLTGVGGQGTLTSTRLLALAAMDAGLDVVSGEIHGMAQRGGVVESTVLMGGFHSPKISPGEADILLGFEPLEALRALSMLHRGGFAAVNTDPIPPLSSALEREPYPSLETMCAPIREWAGKAVFVPCHTLGVKAGNPQSANTALLGAACAAGAFPFGMEAMEAAIKKHLPPKIVDVNLVALRLGADALGG
ncbi:indolepyruvate oxidoreductase subunit iorb [hydrocarbon metagenome]|uniref:Indolepyruvate oxidoreductase subunit iorb n=1 Tax=hydrocarbon metagenome TaxID=938273 RepID=A0A0W8G862_9ZZZZ